MNTVRKRMTAVSIALGVFAFGVWFWPYGATSPTLAQDKGSERESAFEKTIRPLLRDHCLRCHSTKKHKGDLDLERFATVASIKQHTVVWEHVLDLLATGEMPPKSWRQLSGEQKQQLTQWIRETLNEVALANAGDPGPVVLRRLSNHEYTYTIRDLTS